MEQCIYYGHMVGNGTVRPENSTRGTEGFPDYKDKYGSEGISQLDLLLPEVHIKFCETAVPLSDLTRKTEAKEDQWNAECVNRCCVGNQC